MLLLFFPGAGSALLKAYIHGHYRLNPKTGARVWIESHTDKRPERHRASFESTVHRVTHFQHHMALGRQREALHAFHDLDHEDAHKLAQHLGLAGDDKGADKKALMEAIHGKLATKRRELQESMGKEASAKEREEREGRAGLGRPDTSGKLPVADPAPRVGNEDQESAAWAALSPKARLGAVMYSMPDMLTADTRPTARARRLAEGAWDALPDAAKKHARLLVRERIALNHKLKANAEAHAAEMALETAKAAAPSYDPQSRRNTIGGIEFEAVRVQHPIPHWRLKNVATGKVFRDGVFPGRSKPRLWAGLARALQDIGQERFSRDFSAPADVAETSAVERLAGRYRAMLRADQQARGIDELDPAVRDSDRQFAAAVLNRDARALHAGWNLTHKDAAKIARQVFTEHTGVKLPASVSGSWKALREWGGISDEAEAAHRAFRAAKTADFSAFRKVHAAIRALKSKVGEQQADQIFAWTQKQLDEGFTRLQKVGKDTYLVRDDDMGFKLTAGGVLAIPLLRALLAYKATTAARDAAEAATR